MTENVISIYYSAGIRKGYIYSERKVPGLQNARRKTPHYRRTTTEGNNVLYDISVAVPSAMKCRN